MQFLGEEVWHLSTLAYRLFYPWDTEDGEVFAISAKTSWWSSTLEMQRKSKTVPRIGYRDGTE